MNKPNGWDTTTAYTGEITKLPAGGYICRVLGAKEEISMKSGMRQLLIQLDIAEGEHQGFFRKQYNARKDRNGTEAKWPCIFYQNVLNRDGNTNPYCKGLIACIEKSNPGYQWNFDEGTLKDKLIGFVFQEEEYAGAQDGMIRTSVKPYQARSIDVIRAGVDVPPIKRLNSASQAHGTVPSSTFSRATGGFQEVDEEELPF